VDVYRPAARQQLSVIARSLSLPVYEGTADQTPADLAIGARREAAQTGRDVVLVDTAGRLHIDDALMQELEQLRSLLNPVEILYVADAMTGQDAVRSAEEFHKRLGITGVILTKMDGDARGGAALSIRHVTGQPLKFIGSGEKPEALEPFHPSRIASRILGMGDMLSLIEQVEKTVDQKKAVELQQKVLDNEFTLEDFREQLRQLRRMGPLESLMSMLPQAGPFKALQGAQVDPKELSRIEAIISSMTIKERLNYQIINGSRRKRIARGSGTTVQEVNQLLRQYAEVRKMMKSLVSGGSMKRKLSALLMGR
jgi:signal recognition particle subunit SRP54